MPDFWTPNAELPHEAFVERLHKALAAVAEATGVEKPVVVSELTGASGISGGIYASLARC